MKRAIPLILLLCFFITACSSSSDPQPDPGTPSKPSGSNSQTSQSQKGSRDNTPNVLVPSADGKSVEQSDVAVIDYSNASEGYLMVNYTGSNAKVKLQITGADAVTYTYNLSGKGYETFPLTAGSGNYKVVVYENITGDEYAAVLSASISVESGNEFGPYLYPSQYVNFTASSLPIAKAKELAYPANEDLDVISNVYNYIIANFTYDYDKAANVQSGYLPDVDEIFTINTGICFDYAAVMATMLRSQRIPTRLEVGYKGEEYHAWISTYVKDVGWINGVIEFDGKDWKLMDPTFAATSSSPESFTADDDSYITKYVY